MTGPSGLVFCLISMANGAGASKTPAVFFSEEIGEIVARLSILLFLSQEGQKYLYFTQNFMLYNFELHKATPKTNHFDVKPNFSS